LYKSSFAFLLMLIIHLNACGPSCSPPLNFPHCETLYQRGEKLFRIGSTNAFDVGSKDLNSTCFDDSHCADAIVTEKANWDPYQKIQLRLKAAALEVSPPVYRYGQCWQQNVLTGFIIEKKLTPSTLAFISPNLENLKTQITTLLEKLHSNDIIQGDIHLGSIFYEQDSSDLRFYLTDFDKGVDLSKISHQEKEDLIQSENTQASHFFQGNYYLPGEWPPVSENNTYLYWHTLPYKWKRFDQNKNGLIDDGSEFNTVENDTKSHSTSLIIQKLYSFWLSNLQEHVKKGLICDADGDGISTFHELGELADNFEEKQKIIAAYKEYTQGSGGLITLTTYTPSNNSEVVSAAGIYRGNPLRTSQILIMSGGDYHPKTRYFPLITRQSFKSFAETRGFSFNHFMGNAASPKVAYWSKIFMILNKMEDPKNRVIVWFDDDGIADKNQNMIEQYINAYPNNVTIVATDSEFYATLNTGALIVANTKENYALYSKILEVGEETRFNEMGDWTPQYLMYCQQKYWCLHEQQAMQELYLHIKRELPSSGEDCWNCVQDSVRSEVQDWSNYIQIVPQIDLASQRNLNLFADWDTTRSSFKDFSGRTDPSTDQKEKYPFQNKKPFYLQCSGEQDKNLCVQKLNVYYSN
jgi:hypothetical protein